MSRGEKNFDIFSFIDKVLNISHILSVNYFLTQKNMTREERNFLLIKVLNYILDIFTCFIRLKWI